ncbi:MAG TPA: DUF885 family protein [Bryobacteraceae bacterium]|nr:DUF885 family protein [Bryobacteraceae bacterium]
MKTKFTKAFFGVAVAALLLTGERLPAFQKTETLDVDRTASPMRPLMEEYSLDSGNLKRFYNLENSPERRARLKAFYAGWIARLDGIDFNALPEAGKVDYIIFHRGVEHELTVLDQNAKHDAETRPYLPFAPVILSLELNRQQMQPLQPQEAGLKLSQLTRDIEQVQKQLTEQLKPAASLAAGQQRKIDGGRALLELTSLRNTLRTWFTFYNGYDPLFTWWAAADYGKADAALQAYGVFLREKVLGLKPAPTGAAPPAGAVRALVTAQPGDTSDIVGQPVGRDALLVDLAHEMIPYSPEELIAIANREFAWCENEMKRASREMGYGDDWKKALEKVKTLYVEPGKQPQLIRDLALEAQKFVDDYDLVTIPPLARETWRMQMMTPQAQLLNPFFLGGEMIQVSYPTDSMSYERKMTTMRGNNIHFARATVFHELIPGHNLQGYMAKRNRPYREAFGRSPFVTEGWALYWEMLLWDMKFQKTPEDRVGALFWRMHRCARIIFSLSFHLNKMTPVECVSFLVERVGFERENAIGEVRRSFTGDYSPLYQAAYLLGGMQFYALHKELVDSGKMTNRQFHDAILKENYLPIEILRASLLHETLTRDYRSHWKFYGDIAAARN